MKNHFDIPSFWDNFKELASVTPMSPLEASYTLDKNDLLLSELDLLSLNEDEIYKLLSGNFSFLEEGGLSFVYCGHQFGHFAGRLGDGRAHIVAAKNGIEFQLKGAGKTPFSRMGDGRAVYRSSVREYLASEFIHALGIPTTRALGIVSSTQKIQRETLENGAIVLRTSPSFIRFGTFEYLYVTKQQDRIDDLIKYINDFHFHNSGGRLEFFSEVVRRSARLVAGWMGYGFCHGVLNTDNMSILGLSLDYGPYGFLEILDPGYICNHPDHEGRYRYEEQPSIFTWNLSILGQCLELEQTRQVIEENFLQIYKNEFFSLMTKRFLLEDNQDNRDFVAMSLDLLTMKVDLNRFLYDLEHSRSFLELKKTHDLGFLEEWYEEYQSLKKIDASDVNPRYILWNWVTKKIIDECEARPQSMAEFREIFQNPFKKNDKWDDFLRNPEEQLKGMIFSCSS